LNNKLFLSLDDTIHAKARLGIMTLLVTHGELDFTQLKEKLELSDGNLAAHLRILEDAGYIFVNKSFIGRRPKTKLLPTPLGYEAYSTYLGQLESILEFNKNES